MNKLVKQSLKNQAHHLKPVILIGQKGLTENVIAETSEALLVHELIKVKLTADTREEKNQMASILCEATQAELIQIIGNIAVIYKKNPDK